MKMQGLIISILILLTYSVQAADYEKVMSATIDKLYTSNDRDSYLNVSATFERIALAEKDKWLPYYYAGLGYIWSTHHLKDKVEIDKNLDKALSFVEKAFELSADNDEIITLQGYIYMMKVAVDPATRGPEFSGLAMQEFGRAVRINQDNPRALLLLGRMKMGTDQFFGNDITESCQMIARAAQMFVNQNSKSKLDPSWGQEMAELFVNECQGE